MGRYRGNQRRRGMWAPLGKGYTVVVALVTSVRVRDSPLGGYAPAIVDQARRSPIVPSPMTPIYRNGDYLTEGLRTKGLLFLQPSFASLNTCIGPALVKINRSGNHLPLYPYSLTLIINKKNRITTPFFSPHSPGGELGFSALIDKVPQSFA